MKHSLLFLLLFTAAFATIRNPTTAASPNTPIPELLKEINLRTDGSQPDNLIVMNEIAYFAASTEESGRELWRSDGTEAGTFLLKEIAAGSATSVPHGLTVAGNLFYFAADNLINGNELWRSDGTADGTYMLKNIASDAAAVQDSHPNHFLAFNGFVYFTAFTADAGYELWRTDGTPDGTLLLHDISPGDFGSFPQNLTIYNNRIYFSADAGAISLFSTDGTPSGLRNENAIHAEPLHKMVVFDDALFFVSDNAASGKELWRLDDSGAQLVKDIFAGADSAAPDELTVVGERLFFSADNGNGRELWVTDGNIDGTKLVKDIGGATVPARPLFLTAFANKLYFQAIDASVATGNGSYLNAELWMSDGTEQGTQKVLEINPDGPATPNYLAVAGNKLYFSAIDGTSESVWISDGTASGTQKIAVPELDFISGDSFRTLSGERVIFIGFTNDFGRELFITNGSTISLTRDINLESYGSHPRRMTQLDDQLFFIADSIRGFSHLWVTDGTTAGTRTVQNDGDSANNVGRLTNFADQIFFSQFDEQARTLTLRATDGTADGTRTVKTFNATADALNDLVPTETKLFFTWLSQELWVTDGTNTTQVAFWEDDLEWMTALNDTVMFSAERTATGRELWRSDGSTAGTRIVKDIWPGVASSEPAFLTAIDDQLYFSADNGTNGRELWISDGTQDGTYLVKDINTTSRAADSFPQFITTFDGLVYFSADDGVHGRELWVTDGTEAGTRLFKDMNVGGSADPTWATVYNDNLYFVINSADLRHEIWRTDGNPANVTQVTNISPTNDANPQHLTVAAGWLYFAATDEAQDTELYRTNGVTVQQVGEINPNGKADPTWLTEFNGKLIFQAQGESNNRELWHLRTVELDHAVFIPMVVR